MLTEGKPNGAEQELGAGQDLTSAALQAEAAAKAPLDQNAAHAKTTAAEPPAPQTTPQEQSVEARLSAEALIIDVDGWEGPLDLLLTLARGQKVDLLKVSVLQLAEQYLGFVEEARSLRIELAADYLVMAAWLAYLKSKLLLPPDPEEDGPSAAEMAAHLAFQLQRLEAMREVAAQLMARDQKGRDFFARGIPQDVEAHRTIKWTASLLDLMQAYARLRTKDNFRPFVMDRAVFTMDQALERLRPLIGYIGDWAEIESFLPEAWRGDPLRRRSATAATFAASLELVKAGRLEIRQGESFAPIQIRRRAND